MENFTGFYFVSEENVTFDNFNLKIAEAMRFIKESNNLKDDSIKQIRHSFEQEYHIQGRRFNGQYLTFEISKDGEISKHLNCFIDTQRSYMEVIAN